MSNWDIDETRAARSANPFGSKIEKEVGSTSFVKAQNLNITASSFGLRLDRSPPVRKARNEED
jgi:hypothetical protein